MPCRLTLLCHGRTTARPSCFPDNEPLVAGEAERVAKAVARLGRIDRVISSPMRAAIDTASAMAPDVELEPRIADVDLGYWHGQPIATIDRDGPEEIAAWMTDPAYAGHGGESRASLAVRVAEWLEAAKLEEGHTLAVTHPAVIQSAMLSILGGAPASFRHIDVAHLSALDVRSDGARWTIRSLGPL
jgi:broad specificity phosphatase PhoE